MTKEEAILRLKRQADGYYPKLTEALNMAIKALEQQPCEDCISRQAVIDITWENPSYTDALNVLMRRPRTAENGLVFDELNIKESLVIWCKHFGRVERITQPYDYCRKQIKRMSEYVIPQKSGFDSLFPDEGRKTEYMEGLKKALREKK